VDRIVLSQIGGTLARTQPEGTRASELSAKAEHDPLLQVADEEVLFLSQDAATAKYFTTGGGRGSLQGPVERSLAVDHDSPPRSTEQWPIGQRAQVAGSVGRHRLSANALTRLTY